MKNNILIFCMSAVVISLTACGGGSNNDAETDQLVATSLQQTMAINTQATATVSEKVFSEFIYNVGTRFSPIKRSDVLKVRGIDAFLEADELDKIVHLKSVDVVIIENDRESEIREIGYDTALTSAQLELLKSADYSTSFMVMTKYQQMNSHINKLEHYYSSPYKTIVPEKQAAYTLGKVAFKEFLKDSTKEIRMHVDEKKFQAAKLYFTVSKSGSIENVRLDRSSGYSEIDKRMIELITETPGSWKPAENVNGEQVAQELVVSFGMEGC